MKKIILLIAILMTAISWQTNAQVAIGNGTEEESIPINPYFGYSYSQNIYLASEINASGTITSIKFQYNGHSTLDNSKDWVVYLGHTSKTEFDSTTDWIPVADLTEVYNGTITAVGSGSPEWITIDITDFAYNGTDNLVVAVDENTSGNDTSSDDFYASAVTGNRSIYKISDTVNSDPATPPTASSIKAFVPNIIFEGITQTCPIPTDLAVANETTIGADVSWTENGSATAWNIEYGPVGFTQGQGTTVAASSNPFTLSGLTSGTAYDVYVQADCGGGDSSSWAGPVRFNTVCDAKVAPYSQNFDVATLPDLPLCWSKIINSTGTGDFIKTYVYSSPSTPNVVKFGRSNNNAELYLISPEFSDLNNQKMISFKASTLSNPADLIIGIMSDPNDTSTFVAFQTVSLTTSYEDYDIYFASYSGTNHYIAFMPATGSQEPIYFDDFEYKEAPSCIPPSDLAVSNITTTGADVSWTENGSATAWNIEYGPVGFTQGQGTTVAASSNPFTLSGLTSGTAYDVYVQADCGSGDSSSWAGPVSFNTMCEAVSSYPYIEDFETGIPNCWNETRTPANSSHGWGGYNTGHTGKCVRFNSYLNPEDNISSLTTGILDLTSLTNPVLSFYYKNPTGGDFTVSISTDGGANFTALESGLTGQTDWVEKTYYLSSYSSNNVIIEFKGTSNYGSGDAYVYLDDFAVQEAPTCPSPTDLAASNITTTGADISWTENGSATAWNIEYGPAGFTQGQGTIVAASSNPFTLSGLTSETAYDVYVQADCGSGDSSTWIGPFSFITPPGCGETFYDDGGATGNYSANLNQTITIYPANAGDVVTVTFNSFDMENKWDGMMVYDGPDTNAPLIDSGSTYNHTNCPNGAWTGAAADPYTANGHSFTSTDASGALTFVFTSDLSTQHAGWEAVVTCGPQALSENQIAGFKFYPNPVNHTLNLSAKDIIEMISISNVMGQEVLHLLPNATETQVDMSPLQNGIYFVKAQVNGELTAFKVIKK